MCVWPRVQYFPSTERLLMSPLETVFRQGFTRFLWSGQAHHRKRWMLRVTDQIYGEAQEGKTSVDGRVKILCKSSCLSKRILGLFRDAE